MKKLTIVLFLIIFCIIVPTKVNADWTSLKDVDYKATGRVGIGTSVPQALLDIWHPNDKSLLKVAGGAGSHITFNTQDNFGLFQSDGSVIFRFDSNKNNIANHVSFQRGDGMYIMTVKGNGNVGIRTSNPSAELSVNGTILAKQVIVSTAASRWPDYVFEDNYNLKPLLEVEKFINENNHLPGVQPASEIESSGISLGEMLRIQMEKIEELTLYVIELQKQIDELK